MRRSTRATWPTWRRKRGERGRAVVGKPPPRQPSPQELAAIVRRGLASAAILGPIRPNAPEPRADQW
jgi:hypothetical protein